MGKNNKTGLVPGVGRLPYPAYHGDEPYIFISYSHKDSDKVFREIKRFNEDGYHVWYDEGIAPGNEWTDEIASALENCSLFVVFLTKSSVMSPNVKNEIDFAIDENIPAIGIYLEECELQGGLKLRFKNKQAILKYSMDDEEYEYRYTKAFTRLGLKRMPESDEVPHPITNRQESKVQQKITDTDEDEKRIQEEKKKWLRIILISLATLLIVGGIVFGVIKLTSKSESDTTKKYTYVSDQPEADTTEDSSKNYTPKGTAVIETTDGEKLTAIANSLVLKTTGIEYSRSGPMLYMGLDSVNEDLNYQLENMVYFSVMSSVERNGDILQVTGTDNVQTDITLPDGAELWYIGEDSSSAVSIVSFDTVKSIRFDRDTTPDTELKYCRITTTGGSYLSPTAYLWFYIDAGSGGFSSSMTFSKDLTTYSDAYVSVKNLSKLTVDELRSDGSTPYRILTLTAELNDGEKVSFEMTGFYAFFAMGNGGSVVEIDRDELKEIEIL